MGVGSNFPPGVSASMIPGNGPNDGKWEAAEEWALEEFSKAGLSLDEFELAVKMGIAAVLAGRETAARMIGEARADERMIAGMEAQE